MDVHVERIAGGAWCVTAGPAASNLTFRIRDHAVAFAKALAHSRRSDLYLHAADGKSMRRQATSSLTYPLAID